MALQVSDTASNRRDQIANFAELLHNAPTRQKVFELIYRGKKRVKTASELAIAVSVSTKRLTEIAKPLVHEKLFEQGRKRINGEFNTVYEKVDFIATNKGKILQLANNKPKLDQYHTKTNPRSFRNGLVRVTLKLPVSPKTHFIRVDDVDQLSKTKKIKSVPRTLDPDRLPENTVKLGLLRLLGETKVPKDWGGESNDIFTTKLRIRGRLKRASFALKGPAKSGPLVPGKMGKNGDQIQRLFASPAEVFFVQYEGEINESVIGMMESFAIAKAIFGQEIFFGVIDREDTYRLRLAYPGAFRAKAKDV